jgi:SH3-like domain-containing protein
VTEAPVPFKSWRESRQVFHIPDMTRIAVIFLMLIGLAGEATAAPDKVLRYVSQRSEKAYLREGPSYAHKVLWVYRHRGYPYAVLAQFDVWRRVRTPDGTLGWTAASMLTDQRTVLVTGKGRVQLFAKPDGGKVAALADPGAVARLVACTRDACHISGEGVDGWISKSRIWGVDKSEVFAK